MAIEAPMFAGDEPARARFTLALPDVGAVKGASITIEAVDVAAVQRFAWRALRAFDLISAHAEDVATGLVHERTDPPAAEDPIASFRSTLTPITATTLDIRDPLKLHIVTLNGLIPFELLALAIQTYLDASAGSGATVSIMPVRITLTKVWAPAGDIRHYHRGDVLKLHPGDHVQLG